MDVWRSSPVSSANRIGASSSPAPDTVPIVSSSSSHSENVSAVAMHGGRSQSQRTRALRAFSTGQARALVATDVAARGIHVDGVDAVIHYDIAGDSKDYLHRSGRTARAGATGTVISLVIDGQEKETRKLQRELGIESPLQAPTYGVAKGGRTCPQLRWPERRRRRQLEEPRDLDAGNGPKRNPAAPGRGHRPAGRAHLRGEHPLEDHPSRVGGDVLPSTARSPTWRSRPGMTAARVATPS